IEPAERLTDLELDCQAEGRFEPSLDPTLELGLRWRRRGSAQEIIRQERLLALLLLGRADDVIEHPGIVIDVAKIDVLAELLLMLERLALVAQPLPHHES